MGILTERKWMLKELDYTTNVGFLLQSEMMDWVLRCNIAGTQTYKNRSWNWPMEKILGRLRMGIIFGYLFDQAAGYRVFGFGSAGIGIWFHVSDKLMAGWELGLPVFGKVGKTNPERGPQFFRMGFGYEWRTDLFLSMEIEKSSGLPLNVIVFNRISLWGTFLFFIRNQLQYQVLFILKRAGRKTSSVFRYIPSMNRFWDLARGYCCFGIAKTKRDDHLRKSLFVFLWIDFLSGD